MGESKQETDSKYMFLNVQKCAINFLRTRYLSGRTHHKLRSEWCAKRRKQGEITEKALSWNDKQQHHICTGG